MQSVDKNGLYGAIEEFHQGKLQKMLKDPEIERVEVFEGTPENLEKRKKMVGKKYRIRPAYQKAPKIRKR